MGLILNLIRYFPPVGVNFEKKNLSHVEYFPTIGNALIKIVFDEFYQHNQWAKVFYVLLQVLQFLFRLQVPYYHISGSLVAVSKSQIYIGVK